MPVRATACATLSANKDACHAQEKSIATQFQTKLEEFTRRHTLSTCINDAGVIYQDSEDQTYNLEPPTNYLILRIKRSATSDGDQGGRRSCTSMKEAYFWMFSSAVPVQLQLVPSIWQAFDMRRREDVSDDVCVQG
jgi:hypothetical protein